jgi:hypothetical protein
MTWAAEKIYAEGRGKLIAALSARPPLASGLYHLRDLDPVHWFRRRQRHGLPSGGLGVIRAPDDPQSVAPAPRGGFSSELPTDAPGVDVDLATRLAPKGSPDPFLRYPKWLAGETGGVTAFYQAATTWGEDDRESAWVFDGEEHQLPQARGGASRSQGALGPALEKTSVIQGVLEHFGLRLPTRHRAWLRRDFPRERYRVPPPGQPEAPGGHDAGRSERRDAT